MRQEGATVPLPKMGKVGKNPSLYVAYFREYATLSACVVASIYP
jgi:hypothetical protein